ncbi:MAG: ISAs1 family transposase [Ardenticatenaceae bacterium]|nr:ISAs1 family transposase [Ardenticatenaceae bacterium]MCB9418973.1 ISAs1 family transposase [Ardenticatenaceae bacterium]MCB9419628.1 ISAs1 family transposase [Ardenticatenaceae bacterium]MCB9419650.1 ISAs1 family transposase [Ardenticatenaceae bacterium]MCB9419700.1 ISAs1 family transposase [Ardenticatenaceae bacterium]
MPFLLSAILLARLSGEHTPTGITAWIRLRRSLLVAVLPTTRFTAPSLNTIRRVLDEVISADELHRIFRQFLHLNYGGQQSVLITMDGKTLRGTIPAGKTQGVHLLAAYLPEEGIVLAQVEVDKKAKENEIKAAPKLLHQLDLRGRVVSGDAMFAQRKLSVQIMAQGGDYLWFVKSNQPRLLGDVEQFFVPPRKEKGWHTPPLPQGIAQATNKTHGRLEQRTITVMSDDTRFINWPGLRQVFKLERKVTKLSTGKCTYEVVYGITSVPQERADASCLLAWTRHHWGIENGLHYRRDVTLKEDATRMSGTPQASVVATINNFIVGLAGKLGFTNLPTMLRMANAKINFALYNYL